MSLEEEYLMLQQKIKEISKQIISVKNEMILMYDSDFLSPIKMSHTANRMSLINSDVPDDAFSQNALKCCFYQTFMTVCEKQNASNIVVTFPTEDKTVYGVELKLEKDETVTIEKYCLPLYITPEKVFKTVDNLTIKEIVFYLDRVYKCINAVLDRRAQINQFKAFDQKFGNVSISPCNQIIRMKTVVESQKSQVSTNMHLNLHYHPMSRLPNKVDIFFENNILNNKEISKIIEKANGFSQADLLDAYKTMFNIR